MARSSALRGSNERWRDFANPAYLAKLDSKRSTMGNDTASKGRKKRPSKSMDDYESDGGFVNDNEEDAPQSKKQKTAAARSKESTTRVEKGGNDKEDFWELNFKRRVTIGTLSGNTMVGIREYYEDKKTGDMLPGKKGITLTLSQYSTLVTLLPEIEIALVKRGEKVPRPNFSGEKAVASGNEGSESDDGFEVMEKKKQGKENFEATSEEED